MAFPCNQFGRQEPWNETKIKKFATEKYGVEFPMFSKVEVNGSGTHPVYQHLKEYFPGKIWWNFAAKFIVNRAGVVVAREKDWKDIEKTIQTLLDESEAEAAQAGIAPESNQSTDVDSDDSNSSHSKDSKDSNSRSKF